MTREKARARPPRIMVLTVLPIKASTTNAASAGKRNGKQHGGSGAQASQEDQDHQAGEHQADESFMQHGLDGFLHEDGLVENDCRSSIAAGMSNRCAIRSRTPFDDLDGVGVAALLHDGDVGGLLAVDADDVVLNLVGVLRFADVADRDPASGRRS